MRLRRSSTAAIALVAIGGLLAGCGSDDSSGGGGTSKGDTGPIEITAILPTSGAIASVGTEMAKGAQAAVNYINSQGGIDGRKVELTVTDDGGDPTKAVSIVQQMISSGNIPDGVIPGAIPTETTAIVPVLAKAGVFVSQHGTDPTLNDPKKYPLSFGSAYLPSSMAENVASKFKEEGFTSVGMLSPDDVSGHAAADATKTTLENVGIKFNVVYMPPTAVDATSQMQQVIAGNPDVMLLNGYGAAAGPMIKAKAKLKPSMPVYGNQNYSANDLSKVAPEADYDGVTLQAVAWAVKGSPATQTPGFQHFESALADVTKGQYPFGLNTYVVNWNDVINITSAIKLAGSTDPQKMADALEHATQADMPDFLGPVSYSATNHQPLYDDSYWSWTPYAPIVDGQFTTS